MSRVTIVPVEESDLFYVAANMRERDRQEIYATRFSDDPSQLTDDCLWAMGRPNSIAVMAKNGVEPVAVLGAIETWPGTWDLWCFGTEQFDTVAWALTRYCRRVYFPTLLKRGLRRAHCRSMAAHTKAHDWIHSLGANVDCDRPMRNWGKNGEDFVMFEWHRDDLLKIYKEAA